jgi:hypothetical protein
MMVVWDVLELASCDSIVVQSGGWRRFGDQESIGSVGRDAVVENERYRGFSFTVDACTTRIAGLENVDYHRQRQWMRNNKRVVVVVVVVVLLWPGENGK